MRDYVIHESETGELHITATTYLIILNVLPQVDRNLPTLLLRQRILDVESQSERIAQERLQHWFTELKHLVVEALIDAELL